MTDHNPGLLEARLRGYRRVLEVGIGSRTGLAARLAGAGVEVVAVDTEPIDAPPGVEVIEADIRSINATEVGDPEAVYARRLPEELQRPTAELARDAGADCYFTTLGGELPVVTTTTVTGPTETVFVRQADSDTVL